MWHGQYKQTCTPLQGLGSSCIGLIGMFCALDTAQIVFRSPSPSGSPKYSILCRSLRAGDWFSQGLAGSTIESLALSRKHVLNPQTSCASVLFIRQKLSATVGWFALFRGYGDSLTAGFCNGVPALTTLWRFEEKAAGYEELHLDFVWKE